MVDNDGSEMTDADWDELIAEAPDEVDKMTLRIVKATTDIWDELYKEHAVGKLTGEQWVKAMTGAVGLELSRWIVATMGPQKVHGAFHRHVIKGIDRAVHKGLRIQEMNSRDPLSDLLRMLEDALDLTPTVILPIELGHDYGEDGKCRHCGTQQPPRDDV